MCTHLRYLINPRMIDDGLMILDVIHEDENFKDMLNSVVSIKEKRIS